MARTCAQCFYILPRLSFSHRQYAKGEGQSRCNGCVYRGQSGVASRPAEDNGRANTSAQAEFDAKDLERPLASGKFRSVAKGRYISGLHEGKGVIWKWFHSDTKLESQYFHSNAKAIQKARDIVERFNDLYPASRPVKINIPEILTFNRGEGRRGKKKVLQEPFLENFTKFNSNTGWCPSVMTRWGEFMQALSHFSYDTTGGNHVLCDLQGAVYRNSLVLSSPAILSRRREFGVTDLGAEGISSFFSQHECNSYCDQSWAFPIDAVCHFRVRDGTSMAEDISTIKMPIPKQDTRRSRKPYASSGTTRQAARDQRPAAKERNNFNQQSTPLQSPLTNERRSTVREWAENHARPEFADGQVNRDRGNKENEGLSGFKPAEDRETSETKQQGRRRFNRTRGPLLSVFTNEPSPVKVEDEEQAADDDKKAQEAMKALFGQLKIDVICPKEW